MASKIIVIKFNEEKEAFEEGALQSFLQNVDVRNMQRSFFQVGEQAYWSVFVE